MMRKRKIWAESSFAAMKREHNLLKIRKRGILAATEEFLLSAMALNLKRMVKAIFSAMLMDKIWAETMIPQPIFCLCPQAQLLTAPNLSMFCFFALLADVVSQVIDQYDLAGSAQHLLLGKICKTYPLVLHKVT